MKNRWRSGSWRYIARICSSRYYVNGVPQIAYYIDVYGPFKRNRLRMGKLHIGTDLSHFGHKYNARDTFLYYEHGWDTNVYDESRCMRAPSSHLCYPWYTPGNSPLHCFSSAYLPYPGSSVREELREKRGFPAELNLNKRQEAPIL